jgi:hypothetical protein
VDEVLAELTAMARDGTRPQRSGPKPPLAGAALRKAVMAICLFLRYAVAGHRTAPRYPLQHAVIPVFKSSGRKIPLGSFSSRLISLMQACAVEGGH